MTRRRKTVHMLVTVSVPEGVSAAEARREVRTLIAERCNWRLEPGDVKPRRIAAVKPRQFAAVTLKRPS